MSLRCYLMSNKPWTLPNAEQMGIGERVTGSGNAEVKKALAPEKTRNRKQYFHILIKRELKSVNMPPKMVTWPLLNASKLILPELEESTVKYHLNKAYVSS